MSINFNRNRTQVEYEHIININGFEELKLKKEDFKKLLQSRVNFLQANSAESYKNYSFEMARFLPKTELDTLSNNPMHWQYILQILTDHIVFS